VSKASCARIAFGATKRALQEEKFTSDALRTRLAQAESALRLFVAQYEGGPERENRPEMQAARVVLSLEPL